jgi:hypothetical protein
MPSASTLCVPNGTHQLFYFYYFWVQDRQGRTLLDLATMLRSTEAVKVLIKHGVETSFTDSVEDVLAETLKCAGLTSMDIFDPSTGHLNVGVESILLR